MRLIDADALLERMKQVTFRGIPLIAQDGVQFACETMEIVVNNAPAVDAEPVRHGRWIAQDNTYTRYVCSECESKNHGGHEKYCPNCGAKMDGDKDART